jgi:hypothetical protein
MNTQTKELEKDILDKVINRLESLENKIVESWIIKFNGNMLVLSNGKCVWKKKQHASSALTNYLKWVGWGTSYTGPKINKLLQDKGIIEIVQLK